LRRFRSGFAIVVGFVVPFPRSRSCVSPSGTRAEFATTLDRLGRGELAMKSMVTDIVDLQGVAAAFAALRNPDAHGKVLVHP